MPELLPPRLTAQKTPGEFWVGANSPYGPQLTILTIHSIVAILAAAADNSHLEFPIYSRTADMLDDEPDFELGICQLHSIDQVAFNEDLTINFMAIVTVIFGTAPCGLWIWEYAPEYESAGADFVA